MRKEEPHKRVSWKPQKRRAERTGSNLALFVFVLVEPLSQAKSFFGHWQKKENWLPFFFECRPPKLQPKLQPRPEQTCPNPKPKLCVSAHCEARTQVVISTTHIRTWSASEVAE